MKIKKIKLTQDLLLDSVLISAGTELEGFKDENDYKIFHYTGWWSVPEKYFKKKFQEEKKDDIN